MENIPDALNGATTIEKPDAWFGEVCEQRVKRLIYLNDLTNRVKPVRPDTPSSVAGLTCQQLLDLINHSKYSVELDYIALDKEMPDWDVVVDESITL